MRNGYYKSASMSWGFLITMLVILVAGAVGWCMNIYKLWHLTNILSTGEGILRVVGVPVAPLGSILGLFF